MRNRAYLPLLLSLTCLLSAFAPVARARTPQSHNLMPVPAAASFREGRLAVTKTFAVAARGHTDARLRAGIERVLRRLEGRTVMELTRGTAADAAAATLVVEAAGPGLDVPAVSEDESYTLEVTERQAVLKAP